MSVASEFQYDIEVFFVVEVSEYFDDVGVVEEGLYFELSYELVEEVVLDDAFLFDYFQAYDHAGLHFPGEVHAAELAFAQFFDDFEVLFADALLAGEFELGGGLGLGAEEGGEGAFGLVGAETFCGI